MEQNNQENTPSYKNEYTNLEERSSNKTPSPTKLNIYYPLIFSVILVIGMQLGYKLNNSIGVRKEESLLNSDKKKGNSLNEIQEVFRYIDAQYVDTINDNELVEKTLESTLSQLDPHSSYIPAKELQSVNEQLEGNFEGIGIEFSIVDDTIVVVTPISGGPSESLGINAGDKIIKVEDTIVAGIGITNKDVVGKLRGKKGTKVKVAMQREGYPELINYTITRDEIPIYSLDASYMIDNEVGYIKINRFSATVYQEFSEALTDLQQQGMQRLILDLRQNPGGFLNEATNILDEFIERGNLLVYTQGKNYKRKNYNDLRTGMFEQGKLVVMVDEGSASASEIVSGAVQDWDRGVIVGRRTFGKGLVQEQFDLSNGAALRLTVARYYTPSGRCIQRSYEHGTKEYYKDMSKRLEDGELESKDSIKQQDTVVFKTLIEGRKVYGGGGITPDVFVPLDTTRREVFVALALGKVQPFSISYYGKHSSELKQQYTSVNNFVNNFVVNEQIMQQFKEFLQNELKKEFKETIFNRDKKYLSTYIKAQIARQMWQNKGYFQVIKEVDNTLQVAIKEAKK